MPSYEMKLFAVVLFCAVMMVGMITANNAQNFTQIKFTARAKKIVLLTLIALSSPFIMMIISLTTLKGIEVSKLFINHQHIQSALTVIYFLGPGIVALIFMPIQRQTKFFLVPTYAILAVLLTIGAFIIIGCGYPHQYPLADCAL